MPQSSWLVHGFVVVVIAVISGYLSQSFTSAPGFSVDQPNAIASKHPDLVSGTINGTTLIVPIPLASAREVIPRSYRIMEHKYRGLIPSFPAGMYPMVVNAAHDHDIQFPLYNMSIPDFSRAGLEFPFLDVLGDNSSSFKWSTTILVSSSNQGAIEGAALFGVKVHPASFDPPNDAYKASSPNGGTYLSAKATDSSMTLRMQSSLGDVPYPLDVMKSISNQPVFANTSVCDKFVRVFDTPLTSAPFDPVPIKGSVSLRLEPFAKKTHTWKNVYGWRMATAFLEPPMPQPCDTLRGMLDETI